MAVSINKQLLSSGIVQLVDGVLFVVLGIIEKIADYRGETRIPCLSIWMGLWISVSGIIGIYAIRKERAGGIRKALVGVYLGCSLTSFLFAGTMITCYSLTVLYYNSRYRFNVNLPYIMVVLIVSLSIVEFVVAIWASVCCCVFGACCSHRLQMEPERVKYVRLQENPQAAYVIVQGPDGKAVAVPAQTSGPMTELSGTPVNSQAGTVGTSDPFYSEHSNHLRTK